MEQSPIFMPTASADALVRRFVEYYENYGLEAIGRLDEIYTPDIEFVDPVHRVQGVLALKNYLRKMAVNLLSYRMQCLDVLADDDKAYIHWQMTFRHRALNKGKPIELRGMTQIRFTSKVYYHEDCYDLGALLYENLPLFGGITRRIRQRVATQA